MEQMTLKKLNELGIKVYPDNDGGLWYWKSGGGTETVNEEETTRKENEA